MTASVNKKALSCKIICVVVSNNDFAICAMDHVYYCRLIYLPSRCSTFSNSWIYMNCKCKISLKCVKCVGTLGITICLKGEIIGPPQPTRFVRKGTTDLYASLTQFCEFITFSCQFTFRLDEEDHHRSKNSILQIGALTFLYASCMHHKTGACWG